MLNAAAQEENTLQWVWGALQGDFNEDPTVGQIIANAAITAIPLVDQVADARDLVANLKLLIWEKRYTETSVWLGLFFTLIGLIPTLGSLLKGVLKLVYYGANLDDVFKFFNALAKGNASAWLKQLRAGELRNYANDAAQMLKQMFDSIIDTLNEAQSYLPRWSTDLYRKISNLIAEMKIIRGKIDEMFGIITRDLENKLDEMLKKQQKNQVEGSSRGALVKQQEAEWVEIDPSAGRAKALDESIRMKRVNPNNLTEAKNILAERRNDIAAKGYQSKYSDEELAHMAKHGNIAAERFQVRFMETKYLSRDNKHLAGAMGNRLEGKTGTGAKYWSTSFDQLEDADTDPKLICEKLGLTYDPKKNYSLVIIDTQKSIPITGAKSVPATFENVSEFSNTELPDDFPKSFTDKVMTPEFQAEYAKHYKAAKEKGAFKDEWSSDNFVGYLNTTSLSEPDKKLMKKRFEMHRVIGNNEDYLGNGLTKNNNSTINQSHGVVETLNFERQEINLSQLDEIDAITIIPGLKPI